MGQLFSTEEVERKKEIPKALMKTKLLSQMITKTFMVKTMHIPLTALLSLIPLSEVVHMTSPLIMEEKKNSMRMKCLMKKMRMRGPLQDKKFWVPTTTKSQLSNLLEVSKMDGPPKQLSQVLNVIYQNISTPREVAWWTLNTIRNMIHNMTHNTTPKVVAIHHKLSL